MKPPPQALERPGGGGIFVGNVEKAHGRQCRWTFRRNGAARHRLVTQRWSRGSPRRQRGLGHLRAEDSREDHGEGVRRSRRPRAAKFANDSSGMLAIGITSRITRRIIPAYTTPFARAHEAKAAGSDRHEAFHSNGTARALHSIRQNERGKPLERRTCLLVEPPPGLTSGGAHKMAERLANNRSRLPDWSFPPMWGDGAGSRCSTILPQSKPRQARQSSGGEAMSEVAQWALRVQGGKPLIEHGEVRAQLAEMRMLIDASRSYIHRACWLADHREHAWDKTLGALPKAMAAQACWKIATWTMEIHGGHGYMKEFGVEKLLRDAAAFLHSDGVTARCF